MVQEMPTDAERGSKPLEGSESQMKGALSSRLLRSGMRVVMSDLAVRLSILQAGQNFKH